jgi:tight adherence protein B
LELLIIGGAGLVALLILAFGIYSIRRERQAEIDERLGRYTSEYGSQLSQMLEAEENSSMQRASNLTLLQEAADSAIAESGFAKNWKVQLSRADLKLTPAEFLGMHFVSVIVSFLVGYFIIFQGNIILAVLLGFAGIFFPRIYVSNKIGRRLNRFEDQLADNLQMWVNGLRSGYSVLQAIESIAVEAAEPTATEFRRVVKEVQLGIPMDQAFDHMLTRMPSDDLDLVITAVNIQREVGGNLAEILDIISHTIRERIKLKGEIRVLTAQGRVTGYIIGGLPVILLGFLYMVNRPYVEGMFTNRMCGWPMLGCGATMIAMGTVAIQKIIDIEI